MGGSQQQGSQGGATKVRKNKSLTLLTMALFTNFPDSSSPNRATRTTPSGQ
jgi:hypothetical protein